MHEHLKQKNWMEAIGEFIKKNRKTCQQKNTNQNINKIKTKSNSSRSNKKAK